jgi:hypothetical protein
VKRAYPTPASFKAALEQRLRDRSAGSGGELQRLRQLVVFDRFLARLFAHEAQSVVLKGGLVLELRLARARTTKDIDLRMSGAPDAVLGRLQTAGRLALPDYLQFEVAPDPRHPVLDAEGMMYEGRRFRVEPLLAGKTYGRPFGVDVALAEPFVGEPETLPGEPWLDFAGVERGQYRVYPLESHIAEKLHAYTLPRTRLNSRVKDLPDLALLSQVRPVDSAVLRHAIDTTFTHRDTHPLPAALPDPPTEWEPVYAEMARVDQLPWPTLRDVTTAAQRFLDPVLSGGTARWDPTAGHWNPQP